MSTFYTNTASIDNLIVTSSAILSGSVTVYGSLTATASYSTNAISSSYALTASYSANVPLTSSYSLMSLSSSYAATSSYVINAISSSRATTAASSSVSTTASYATTVEFPLNNVAGASGLTSFFINQDLNYDPSGNRNIQWADLLTDIAGTNLASDGDSINLNTTITGLTSVTSTSFTGSLQGTATTASYYGGTVTSASFASTASFLSGGVTSASFASTASFLSGGVTSASYASTASFLSGGVTSASYASTASFLSGGVTSASYAQTATTASYSSQEFVNVETLSADKTLTINDKPIQILTPNSANRNITLPTSGVPDGFKFEIWNKELYSESFYLYVNSSEKVDSNTKAIFRYDSSTTSYIKEYARNISIGGNNYGNYGTGVGVGYGAYNNYTGGVGIGGFALSNYAFGVGVGYGASSNREYGVGVGNDATSNYLYGVGIGASAIQNYSNGVGIGYNSYSNFNYAVGIGSDTTANSKGVGTVAIGAYTKAQRQNEFVTTGTDSVTNKAQSIIQKFRNKALATAAGAFQEIFTDASSGRLTIFASSIYQFRIQINAIEATGFKCKTWEITGGIKRNGSSVTTMVGGAPTYYITSEDSGTGNWDVKVSADDTNEALKIEVKHDSANNVTFSATVWATETRL